MLFLAVMGAIGEVTKKIYSSIMALMTPVSGLTQDGKRPAASAKAARWVIQGVRVDAAVFDQMDDAREIRGQRVAAGQERQLAAVEIRVVERHLALEQSHERQPPAVRGILEGRHHGFRAAGGVETPPWAGRRR